MLESLHHTISQKVPEIFDLYTELHGVRISLWDPAGNLIYPSKEGRPDCRHCSMLRTELGMDSRCRELDHKMMRTALQKNDMITYRCHAGMREAAAPLMVDHELVGFVMIGQFRSEAAPATSPYSERWEKERGDDALQREFEKTPIFPEEKIKTLLAMFCHLIELMVRSQLIHHKDYDLIEPVIEQLRRQPETGLSLEEAARMAGRSPSTVSRLFKKITGRSFKQYQIWFRLQHAGYMLKTRPNSPVLEIAQAVGFDDPFYFSRLFHKHMGLSPSQYRRGRLSGDALPDSIRPPSNRQSEHAGNAEIP
jgi:AraC-like DNA-binding protein